MTTKSNSSRRGASRAKSTGKSSGSTLPGWVWLVAGLLIGVFVAFLAGLTPSAKDVRTVTDQVASEPDKAEKKENQPVFDFYTLLPETEITVPAVTPEPVRETAEVKAAKAAAKAKTEQARPAPTAAVKYLLQAGSFRNVSDAERLRARLLLEGLSPKIEKVNVSGGETWHRVQIGPFSNSADLKSAQKVLASQNIDSLLLQLK